MTKDERLIKNYNKMSIQLRAIIVYNYHVKMQENFGKAVQGHESKKCHRIKDTARDFCMSVGAASVLVKIGGGIKDGA